MKKLTRKSLGELARTMSVIPQENLVNFTGGDDFYKEFNSSLPGANEMMLRQYLDNYRGDKEVTFLWYSDGSCAVWIDDRNYFDGNRYYNFFEYGETSNANGDILYNFPGYTNGRYITSIGHNHFSDSVTGGGPSPYDDLDAYPGITKYIWYNGNFHTYGN